MRANGRAINVSTAMQFLHTRSVGLTFRELCSSKHNDTICPSRLRICYSRYEIPRASKIHALKYLDTNQSPIASLISFCWLKPFRFLWFSSMWNGCDDKKKNNEKEKTEIFNREREKESWQMFQVPRNIDFTFLHKSRRDFLNDFRDNAIVRHRVAVLGTRSSHLRIINRVHHPSRDPYRPTPLCPFAV